VKRLAPLALLALAALLAGCGSGAGGPAATAAPQLPSPKTLVLHAADLGPGHVPQASATKPITLAHELRNESARAQDADVHSYVAGYSAGFPRPGQVGIVSQVLLYRDARAARIVIGDAQAVAHITRQLHAHAIAPRRARPERPGSCSPAPSTACPPTPTAGSTALRSASSPSSAATYHSRALRTRASPARSPDGSPYPVTSWQDLILRPRSSTTAPSMTPSE
jgi:hypothetical protein